MFTSSTKFNPLFWASLSLLCTGPAGLLSAAPARNWITAPVVGLAASQDGSEVRAVLGVPGSSTLSDPLPLPEGATRVFLAPGQRWALVEQASNGSSSLAVVAFTGAQAGSARAVYGAILAPDLVSFSPTGRSAVLLDRASGLLQAVSGLDSAPRVAMETSVSDLNVAAIAVSDDGTLPVVMTVDGNVYLVSGSESRKLIFSVDASAGMGFLPNRAAVAIADVTSGTVSVIDDLANAPTPAVVASAAAIAGGAGSVRASVNGRFLFVSAAGGRSAFRIDLSQGDVVQLDLPVVSTSLDRLGEGEVFLLSASPGESAWMLVSDSDGLKAVFAPQREQPVE